MHSPTRTAFDKYKISIDGKILITVHNEVLRTKSNYFDKGMMIPKFISFPDIPPAIVAKMIYSWHGKQYTGKYDFTSEEEAIYFCMLDKYLQPKENNGKPRIPSGLMTPVYLCDLFMTAMNLLGIENNFRAQRETLFFAARIGNKTIIPEHLRQKFQELEVGQLHVHKRNIVFYFYPSFGFSRLVRKIGNSIVSFHSPFHYIFINNGNDDALVIYNNGVVSMISYTEDCGINETYAWAYYSSTSTLNVYSLDEFCLKHCIILANASKIKIYCDRVFYIANKQLFSIQLGTDTPSPTPMVNLIDYTFTDQDNFMVLTHFGLTRTDLRPAPIGDYSEYSIVGAWQDYLLLTKAGTICLFEKDKLLFCDDSRVPESSVAFNRDFNSFLFLCHRTCTKLVFCRIFSTGVIAEQLRLKVKKQMYY